MRDYLDLLQDVLDNGTDRGDRTGTGTRSVFGRQLRFDLQAGFPLVTTKRVFWRGVVAELLWMLSGDTNVRALQEQGVHIWDEWADARGRLGPVYGEQWRSWATGDVDRTGMIDTIDQIAEVIDSIKYNPNSRRHIVTAWNPVEVDYMALPPCHTLFQFCVADGRLSCQLYQRSADLFLGVPFNIASYALLTHMIAHVCRLEVGEFVHTFGDAHIYHNHFGQVREQLQREPRVEPVLSLEGAPRDIDGIRAEHIHLHGYDPHPTIRAPVAV